MCGRFTITSVENFHTRYGISNFELKLEKSYNVSPGRLSFVVTNDNDNNLVERMKWGLIPFWTKDPRIGYKLINARAESISSKPSFRQSFKSKRCLIPASGFYEWKKTEKEKQPYYIHLKDQELFSFAGIYDEWRDPEDKIVRTFAIITTEPNESIKEIHNRMPVILSKSDENVWIDDSTNEQDLMTLLHPFDEGEMDVYRVSDLVNSPKNNSEKLIKPLN